MGPFDLMDLIGHDVNFAVTRSVYDALFQDPRYRPSLVQKDLVDAGLLGRKSGRGFYDYRDGAEKPAPALAPTVPVRKKSSSRETSASPVPCSTSPARRD